jgi:hypothetical protein
LPISSNSPPGPLTGTPSAAPTTHAPPPAPAATPVTGGGVPTPPLGGQPISVATAALLPADISRPGNAMATRLGHTSLLDLSIQPALPLAALTRVNTRGVTGAVFAVDSDSVRGLRVNVRRIVHPEMGPGLELNFKLRNPKDLAAVKTAIQGRATQGTFELRAMIPDAEGRLVLASSTTAATRLESLYNASTTHAVAAADNCWTLKGDHHTLDVLMEPGTPRALFGKVRLRVFGTTDAELRTRFEQAVEGCALKSSLAPSTELSHARASRMRLLWQANPAKAAALGPMAGEIPLVELDAVLKEAGVLPKDIAALRIREVAPGHLTTVMPSQSERYTRLGVQYVFAGVGSAEQVVKILKAGGMYSTEERLTRGLLITGASSHADLGTGGGDYVFTRMVTEDAVGVPLANASFAGAYQLAFSPQVLDRTDWFAYPQDTFGSTDPNTFAGRHYNERLVRSLVTETGEFHTGNEVMFERAMSARDLDAIFTATPESRQELLTQLAAAGITNVGRKRVEDLVQVRQQMVTVTPSRVQRFFKTRLTMASVQYTPTLDRFIKKALADHPTKAEKFLELINAFTSQPAQPAQPCMDALAAEAGQPSPQLRLDRVAFSNAARSAFEAVGYTWTPEVSAFLEKVDFQTTVPVHALQTIRRLEYESPESVLPSLVPAAVMAAPALVLNQDAVSAKGQAAFAQNLLVFSAEAKAHLVLMLNAGMTLPQCSGLMQAPTDANTWITLNGSLGVPLWKPKADVDAWCAALASAFAPMGFVGGPSFAQAVHQAQDAGKDVTGGAVRTGRIRRGHPDVRMVQPGRPVGRADSQLGLEPGHLGRGTQTGLLGPRGPMGPLAQRPADPRRRHPLDVWGAGIRIPRVERMPARDG